jgi:hypothetical protein
MNGRMALSLIADPSLDTDLGLLLQPKIVGGDRYLAFDLTSGVGADPGVIATGPERASAAWGPTRFEAVVDEMQEFLNVLHPSTDAEALQSLRLAFPTVPLAERIAAIRSRFFA